MSVRAITSLMLPLLLLAQAWIGIVPGRMLCIGTESCAQHAAHTHGCAEHHREEPCGHDRLEIEPCDDCGQHLHVALPDGVSDSRVRLADRYSERRLIAAALPILASLDVDRAVRVQHRAAAGPERVAWHATDQCRARETTRLLI